MKCEACEQLRGDVRTYNVVFGEWNEYAPQKLCEDCVKDVQVFDF